MSIERILLVGAGGHCLVVLDALITAEKRSDGILIFDESVQRIGLNMSGLSVRRFDPDADIVGKGFHVSIGGNSTRAKLFEELKGRGGLPKTIIHPVTTIATSADIGDGTFVAARAIVAPSVVVGEGVIVNHGAIVDHECMIGHFCHLAPGATLAGNVRLGKCVLVGAGANVLPGVSVGDAAIIGAGAVVTADVPPGATFVGVPARRIR